METYKKSIWKERLARLLAAVFLVQVTVGNSFATPTAVPLGSIDLSMLAAIQPSLGAVNLLTWRTGSAINPATGLPAATGGLNFAYFDKNQNPAAASGNLPAPNRTTTKDWTCNDQNDCWSDNALQVNFTKGNDLFSAIVVYTANHSALTGTTFPLTEVANNNDPLEGVALRGGLVGCVNGGVNVAAAAPNASTNPNPTCANDTTPPSDPGRQVILPVFWKAVPLNALIAASTTTIVGANALPTNSPLDMYTEIQNTSGGTCLNPEFLNNVPGKTYSRTSAGFCDYSSHYLLDLFNLDPNNLFYTAYPKIGQTGGTAATQAVRQQKFNYQSVVGAFGINTSDNPSQPGGGGATGPAYLLLGASFTNAVPAHYGTVMYVESVTF